MQRAAHPPPGPGLFGGIGYPQAVTCVQKHTSGCASALQEGGVCHGSISGLFISKFCFLFFPTWIFSGCHLCPRAHIRPRICYSSGRCAPWVNFLHPFFLWFFPFSPNWRPFCFSFQLEDVLGGERPYTHKAEKTNLSSQASPASLRNQTSSQCSARNIRDFLESMDLRCLEAH